MTQLEVASSWPLGRRTLAALLLYRATRSAGKVALRGIFGDIRYDELYERAGVRAAALASAGVLPGDRVLLMCGNTLDHVLNWLGIVFAGAVEVPINTGYVGNMLRHVINDSGARLAVIERAYLPQLDALWDETPALQTIVVCGLRAMGAVDQPAMLSMEELLASPREPLFVERQPHEPIALMYTSGTTGPAKGVCITHAHAFAHCLSRGSGAPAELDVVLVSLPLFHIGGQWNGIYQAWVMNATAALLERFSASRFWVDAQRLGATYTTLLGAQASFLMAQPESPTDVAHGIRRVSMLPLIEHLDAFKRRFHIQGVRTGYGTSEGGSPIGADFDRASPGACGWLKPGYEARLVDDNDEQVPRGQPGELLLRTSEPWTLMLGYHGHPEKTLEAFRNQWLHTGDLFRQDDSGQFFFLDRNKDAIRCRGENISSFEVEREVCAHTSVAEAAAVAIPSSHTEDELMVFVTLREGGDLSPSDLVRFISKNAPRHMVPRYVEIVTDLPRTPTNRVQKHLLRARGVGAATWDRLEQD